VTDGEKAGSLAGWWMRVRDALQPGSGGPRRVGAHLADDALRASKALRRLFDVLRPLESPVLLDLGPVTGQNVSFLGGELHCKVHIHDLFADIDVETRRAPASSLASFLAARLDYDPGSMDAILAWDLLDYLDDDEARALVARLASIVRPGGFVLAFFSTILVDDFAHRKYLIEDVDHLRHRRVAFARQPQRLWLGRDVERVFAPLEVSETYLLTHHQRETLLRRPVSSRPRG